MVINRFILYFLPHLMTFKAMKFLRLCMSPDEQLMKHLRAPPAMFPENGTRVLTETSNLDASSVKWFDFSTWTVCSRAARPGYNKNFFNETLGKRPRRNPVKENQNLVFFICFLVDYTVKVNWSVSKHLYFAWLCECDVPCCEQF